MTVAATLRAWPGWPWLRRAAPWALALLVLALVAYQARGIDWHAVVDAARQQPTEGLAIALALTVASHALFASYDLVGRHLVQHRVGAARTLRIAAIAYAFNLNFGSLVGALALKLRLYTRAGLDVGTVGRVIAASIATNWLGYLLLGGTVLALAPPPLPATLVVPPAGVRLLGGAMAAAGLGYLAVCAFARRREIVLRGHRFEWPDVRVALWQAAVSVANWALMGVIVWTLLQQALPYPTVLAVLLLAAVAGVVTHVPAGVGVLEAVFVACLGAQVPQATLLAALLAYRAVYYLVPLVVALAAYALAEAGGGAPRRL